jgi:hypothetical protein
VTARQLHSIDPERFDDGSWGIPIKDPAGNNIGVTKVYSDRGRITVSDNWDLEHMRGFATLMREYSVEEAAEHVAALEFAIEAAKNYERTR